MHTFRAQLSEVDLFMLLDSSLSLGLLSSVGGNTSIVLCEGPHARKTFLLL